jgi:5-(carboxyamino)imidazole ribonucleotide synthase
MPLRRYNPRVNSLPPGSRIGILGSGQLGRMTAQAAIRMGYRVSTFSPDASPTPCAQAGADEFTGNYNDLEAVEAFARGVDVVTFEFENVSAAATEVASRHAPVRPGGHVLHTTQDRIREKTFLAGAGIPVAAWRAVHAADDLAGISGGILKTAGFGYDGKGQRAVDSEDAARAAFAELGQVPCVLEAKVDFAYEASVVAARGVDGQFKAYPLVRNHHARHILDVTEAPSGDASPAVRASAEDLARTILTALDVVGVLCVELFVLSDGSLIVNELAPRPHNSGHWTIEGCAASQFEQQVRAVCGLPLGDTTPRAPGAAMANLLGDLWPAEGEPNWSAALAIPGVALHLYGKRDARPGRKMGHLTALGPSAEDAARTVREARAALSS